MPATITMHRNQVQTVSGINILAGIWLFISAWAVYAHGPMVANNIVFGAIVTVLALIRVSGAYDQSWLSWLNAVCGLWVVLSPWAIMGTGPNGGPTQAMIINNCITGGIVAVFACWSALATDTDTVISVPDTRPYAQ